MATSSTLSSELYPDLDDTAQDVVAALINDGYKPRHAEAIVRNTYRSGLDFSEAYKRALQSIAGARANGTRIQPDAAAPARAPIARSKNLQAASPQSVKGESQDRAAAASARSEPEQPEKPMPSEKICGAEGCGAKLQERNESGYCSKHYYLSKRDSDEIKTCSVRGCGARLRSDNQQGLCKAHRGGTASGKVATKKPARRSVNSPRSRANGAPSLANRVPDHIASPAVRENNTITVNELDLDNLWARLPHNKKFELMFGRAPEAK